MGKLKKGLIRLSCKNTMESKSELNGIADCFCPVGSDFYGLFNAIQDFIFILNSENKILFFNSSFVQLEYEEAELQGKSILDLYPVERRDEALDLIKELTPANKSCTFNIPFLKKSGQKIEIETKLILGRWEDKDSIIGICRDSSEKRNYEQELKNSNQQLEMVLLASDAGWWNWVTKDNKLTVNEKWCAMRGYSPDEIEPQVDSWKNLVHPDDYPMVAKNLGKHLRNEIPLYQAEYRIKTKSEGYVWILDTGKVTEFNEDGSPLRVVGINIDINSHKLS
ncbi:MAG TPA: PAS domain-containing protein, partial [Bacteroidales bacterium]|nr:PAS domain-containing protein [Bacteroidales bacterium]